MRYFIFLLVLFLHSNAFGQELSYKIDDKGDYYYEKVIELKNKSTQEIREGLLKFFKINNNDITYTNEDEIHGSLTFDAQYRGHMLIFFNTHDYDAVYDLSIYIKDNRIKYIAQNFKFYDKYYKVRSSYFSGFSTSTKIPTSINYKMLKNFKRKKHPKHLIFQKVEKEIAVLEIGIVNSFNNAQEDW